MKVLSFKINIKINIIFLPASLCSAQMLMVLKMTETKVGKPPLATGRWTDKTTLQCLSDLLISCGPSTAHEAVFPTVDVYNVACTNKLMDA